MDKRLLPKLANRLINHSKIDHRVKEGNLYEDLFAGGHAIKQLIRENQYLKEKQRLIHLEDKKATDMISIRLPREEWEAVLKCMHIALKVSNQ